jgi:tetratricopeptide (TPR) repeat protein
MAPVILCALLAATAAATGLSERKQSCDEVAQALTRALHMAELEMEPEGTVRRVYTEATDFEARCRNDERIAYLRLRSAELGRGALVGQSTPQIVADWKELARVEAKRFPASAPVLTVAARASGDVDLARRAVKADPRYAPASVALAQALVDAGRATDALQVLAGVRALDATVDGFVVLGRARFATGDYGGALQAATDALQRREIDLIEPDAGDFRPTAAAHEIAARAALALGRYQQAAEHLLQADPRSPAVRELLAHPTPELRRALRAHGRRAPRP